MALRMLLLLTLVVALLAPPPSFARAPHVTSDPRGLSVDGVPVVQYDLPATHTSSHARGSVDTIWWGGVDASGVAIPGGTWDFEGGPLGTLQGWTSTDLTDVIETLGLLPVRRVTPGTFGPGDVDATITQGGSMASLWFGALQAETEPGCWPGGQGYSNDWSLYASKPLTWGGGDVTIAMDYFVDSEIEFDFSYVYVENSDGVRSAPLNASVNGRPGDGLGWSGQIGTPAMPAHEEMVVDAAFFEGASNGPGFEVLLNFDSDPVVSDGMDSFAGFLNTVYGPLGADDIAVTGTDLADVSDFESGEDGWSFSQEAPIGAYLTAAALSELDPVEDDPCGCPLSGNVMVATRLDGMDLPHPEGQHERLTSPPAYVGGDPTYLGRIVGFDTWMDLPLNAGLGYRIAMDYYPWICPVTLATGWTVEPLDQGGGYVFNSSIGGAADCVHLLVDNTQGMPTDVDSIRIVFELLQGCDVFGGPCDPANVNQSPYWDNVRLGAYGLGVDAPVIAPDVLYQDVYSRANTLLPNATADIHSQNDNNRADGDPTNANMGDSAVVVAGTEPMTEVYLNFRVYPGPMTDTSDPWFSEYGGNFIAPGGGWAKARMDTAEVGFGSQLILGSYSTYDWPDGQEDMTASFPASSDQKIIEDGVLTPGATVEYFFSANYGSTPAEQSFSPDTTGTTYFEFEVLPGYFDVGNDILAPCLLYVDAFNAGAQQIIEDRALRNLVGQVTDVNGLVHDNWDRYDYFGAASNTPGPLAREINGDNGMTAYQSLLYRTILYNTGGFSSEGLRDGDAALLINFLESDDFNRPNIDKGLWLSGDGMGSILSRFGRTSSNALLSMYAGASLVCNSYGAPGCGGGANGDESSCIRLDAAAGSQIPQSAPYAASRGGCASPAAFDVLGESGGSGNLDYVDQDDGETTTSYASINNDTFGGDGRWGVVLDGFSLHRLRGVEGGATDPLCPTDSLGVLTRAADVFSYLLVDLSPGLCAPPDVGPSVGENGGPVAVTRLLRNSPNPFNPKTSVRYELHDRALVTLDVYDVTGRRVRSLVDGVQEAGRYAVTWDGAADDGRNVGSGVYWVRMRTSLGFESSTKMVVLK